MRIDYEVIGTCVEFDLGCLSGEYVAMNTRMLLCHRGSGGSQAVYCPTLLSLGEVESWLRENYSQLVADIQAVQ